MDTLGYLFVDKRELIGYRIAQDSDLPFIYRSTLLGVYHGNKPGANGKPSTKCPVDFFSSIDQDTFMAGFHTYIEQLLGRPEVTVNVACLTEDPDVILGYSIVQPGVLHFVFVKPAWRKNGIAKALIPQGVHTVTGFTRVGDILRRKYNLKFNPWS